MKQTIYQLTYKHQLGNDKKKKILNQLTVFSRAGKNNSGPTNMWRKDHEKQNSKNNNNETNKLRPVCGFLLLNPGYVISKAHWELLIFLACFQYFSSRVFINLI